MINTLQMIASYDLKNVSHNGVEGFFSYHVIVKTMDFTEHQYTAMHQYSINTHIETLCIAIPQYFLISS